MLILSFISTGLEIINKCIKNLKRKCVLVFNTSGVAVLENQGFFKFVYKYKNFSQQAYELGLRIAKPFLSKQFKNSAKYLT